MQKKIDWKNPAFSALLCSFLVGLAVHMFGLVNVLHNGDDVFVQPTGYGSGVRSGRFFLQFLGELNNDLLGGYNLPWVNGVLLIALIAVAACITVVIFDIQSKKIAAAIGAIFVTFPPVAATLDYRFTSVYYGIAIVLAVFAAWFLVKCKFGIVFSALCSALALGIYQAYLPLTTSILVLYLLKQVLEGNLGSLRTILKGVYFCVALILGFLLYKLLLNICLEKLNTTLVGYQNINEMGVIKFAELPKQVSKTMRAFYRFPVDDYVMLAQTDLLKLAYCCVYLVTLVIVVFITIARKLRIDRIILIVLLTLALPIAINLIMIMCPNSSIHCLMVYGFVMVPCLPIVLLESFPKLNGVKEILRRIVALFSAGAIAVILICNCYMTNVNYAAAYYANRQTENYVTSMVAQIRMTEGFNTEKKWAVIGVWEDPLLTNRWQDTHVYMTNTKSSAQLMRSWYTWLITRYGYNPVMASENEVTQLKALDEVSQMPCWPSEGSVKVVDSYIVIKLSEDS